MISRADDSPVVALHYANSWPLSTLPVSDTLFISAAMWHFHLHPSSFSPASHSARVLNTNYSSFLIHLILLLDHALQPSRFDHPDEYDCCDR